MVLVASRFVAHKKLQKPAALSNIGSYFAGPMASQYHCRRAILSTPGASEISLISVASLVSGSLWCEACCDACCDAGCDAYLLQLPRSIQIPGPLYLYDLAVVSIE